MDHQIVEWKQLAICNTRWNWTWEHWRQIQLMVKVGYEQDETALIPNTFYISYTKSWKYQSTTAHHLYENRNFQDDAAGYWAALLLALHFYPSRTKSNWLRPQVHPGHTPAWRNNRHCDGNWSSQSTVSNSLCKWKKN